MKIADFFLELGMKADTETLGKVNDAVKTLGKGLAAVQIAWGAALFGLERFVNGTLDGVVALKNLNQQTGLSIEKLQEWQQAAQLSNLAISAEQIAASIGNLQQSLSAIKMGQGNAAPFQMLGIDVNGKDAFQVLEQVRARIKGLDAGVATNLISQLGLNPEMINVLRLSNAEFQKLGQNIFLSRQQRDNIYSLGLAFRELTLRLSALKDQAVAKIAPELERLIKNFFQWMKDNGDKIIAVISGIANAFTIFVRAVGNAFALVSDLVMGLFNAEGAVKALAAAFGLLALNFAPFTVGLLLLIALLDDIRVWQKGGDSLFGNFYSGISNFINKVSPMLKIIRDFLIDIKNLAGEVGEKLSEFGDKLGFGKELKELTEVLKTTLKGGLAGAAIGSVVPGVGTVVGGGLGLTATAIQQAFQGLKNMTNNNITMNIVSGGDAQETAKLTVEQLIQAQSALNNGGR
jgi:hypothetical protein